MADDEVTIEAADDLHYVPTRTQQRLAGRIELRHPDVDEPVFVSPRQARVLGKSGWFDPAAPPVTEGEELPNADESAPTPNPED